MIDNLLMPLLIKWRALPPRDQKALTILGYALAVTLLVFGWIMPLVNSQASLQEELGKAQNTYQQLVALAPKAMTSNAGTSGFNVNSLNSEIRRQAARNGLSIQRFEPDGEFLKVWLEDVRYPSVVQWLGGLEALGVSHTELNLEKRSKPGFVSVRATFGLPSN